MKGWEPEGEKPESVRVGGALLRRGDRVRLRPEGRTADIFDLVLEGKVAIIESIEQDYEGRIHLSVTVEDDPGRDLGIDGKPAHRFFFRAEEVEPFTASEEGKE
jgi:hypothetical protein